MAKMRAKWGSGKAEVAYSGGGARRLGVEVRVSGGEFRGRRLATPGGGTHPMGERERAALFNMISGRLPGGCVADLYCGGGTLGIEALSRGASFVTFVERSPRAVAVAKENIRKLGVEMSSREARKIPQGSRTGEGSDDGSSEASCEGSIEVRAEVVLSDVSTWARGVSARYDVVIADPPYDKYNARMVEGLPKLLRDGGVLVLSHPGEAPDLPGLTLEKSRSYAGARISIYEKFMLSK